MTQAHPPSEQETLSQFRRELASATPESTIRLVVQLAAWIKRNVHSYEGWALLGDVYLHVGQAHAATTAYRTALEHCPDFAPAMEGLGLVLLSTNSYKEAASQLGKAHDRSPKNPDILIHWGLALARLGHLKPAYNRFRRALELRSDHPHAWHNLGLVDTQRGAWQSAAEHFRKATTLKPDFKESWYNLAMVYRHLGLLSDALDAASHLTSIEPQRADDWALMAELQLNAGDLPQADNAIKAALSIDPSHTAIHLARASWYSMQREYDHAEGTLTTALVLSHDDPNVQLELAHLQLLKENWAKGWENHEARKKIASTPIRRFALPHWTGQDLSHATILVHAEQGLGDTIMFAHCLNDLLQLAEHVVIEVSTRLAPLFQHSFPDATVIGRDPQSADLSWMQTITPPITYQTPIGSLPLHFRKQSTDFLRPPAYLRAAPERVNYWRQRLSELSGPAFGLSWRGGLLQTGREHRSIPLSMLASSLSELPVRWINLQYGDIAREEIATIRSVGFDVMDWIDTDGDQLEVAALTCALTGVVTVCNTQAHLAGALGCPTWVLTPFNPSWRYGATRDEMSWYPSVRLLRQTQASDWHAPLSALRATLLETQDNTTSAWNGRLA